MESPSMRRVLLLLLLPTLLAFIAVGLWMGCGGSSGGTVEENIVAREMVAFGYNDLGMHCMNQDFSELCVLPPFNTLHAQVVDRSGEDPRIVTGGVTVQYATMGNTHSADKTNFWQYASALFGTALSPNIGLAGNGLSGAMKPTGDNDWSAVGIPVTPIDDRGKENPYPLATISVLQGSKVMAQTMAVVPVSWEMRCDLCHKKAGISTATDILRAHDRLHKTTLEKQKPVLCAKCHADNALGMAGQAGIPNLSRAMHKAHGPRMAMITISEPCYACHPGMRTQCLRDVHYANGMRCTHCHGPMQQVADPARRPWLDEPRCGSCHSKSGFQFEQPGTLYRNSKGHHGIHCEACHGSPHAVTPTTKPLDNAQAIALQGKAGPISKCVLCHKQQPDDSFDHRLSDDGGGDGGEE